MRTYMSAWSCVRMIRNKHIRFPRWLKCKICKWNSYFFVFYIILYEEYLAMQLIIRCNRIILIHICILSLSYETIQFLETGHSCCWYCYTIWVKSLLQDWSNTSDLQGTRQTCTSFYPALALRLKVCYTYLRAPLVCAYKGGGYHHAICLKL